MTQRSRLPSLSLSPVLPEREQPPFPFYRLLPPRSRPICSFDILESIKRGDGYGYARKKAARIQPGGITNSIQWEGEGRRRISSR